MGTATLWLALYLHWQLLGEVPARGREERPPLLFLQEGVAYEPSSEVPLLALYWKMTPVAQLPSISEIRFSVSFSIIFC